MTPSTHIAYALGNKHAQAALGLMPLLPKQEQLFLQQLTQAPLPGTLQSQSNTETNTFSPNELRQLGQLSRIATLSPNPAMKLTGRFISKALNTAAEEELTNAPTPPQGI